MVSSDYHPYDFLQGFEQHLASYLEAVPFLIWRINVVKKEITFFNTYHIQGLGRDTPLLLKNMEFARKTVLGEDLDRFENFMDRVHGRQSASVLFRIKNHDGMMLWVQASGMPDPSMSSCYMGMLTECTSLAAEAQAMDTPSHKLESRIELFHTPVFLCRFDDKRVVMTNSAALLFLGRSRDEVGKMTLYDLLCDDDPDRYMGSVYESLIFADRWTGQLPFTDCQRRPAMCDVSIRSLASGGQNYLWVGLSNPRSRGTARDIGMTPEISGKSLQAIAQSSSLPGLLESVLAAQPLEAPANAVMLSRVFIDENRITVAARGAGFDPEEESTHPYKGSIAENIVNFDLEHILVGDTSKSIKPIDWALFIPKGVRSYYAQPFFSRDILCHVLIFCSTEPDGFDETTMTMYRPLFAAFEKGLERCLMGTSQDT
ncbi:hypothetical protein [Desulfoplanes sp.]